MYENVAGNAVNAISSNSGGWIGAAASTVGSALGNVTGLINQNRQNRWNQRMAEYQYSRELENWNRQNAYNSPEAQMQRLKDAGLNPNLVYGSSANTGNASVMPRYNAPTASFRWTPPNVAEMLGTFQDFQVKQAQINNLKAQNSYINANTAVTLARKGLLGYEADLAQQKYAWNEVFNPYKAKVLEWQGKNQMENQKATWFKNLVAETLVNSDYYENQIKKTYSDLERSQADALSAGIEAKWKQLSQAVGVGNPVGQTIISLLRTIFAK